MPSTPTVRRDPTIVSHAMRQVKGKDTTPELLLRKALWRRGHRYRLHDRRLPGSPDIVFTRAKVAVFVDGDFWHGAQWRHRGKTSLAHQLEQVNNKAYWMTKIEKNMARDKRNNATLRRLGWRVIRVWESSLKQSVKRQVTRIERALAVTNR